MDKSKFRDHVRSKTDMGMANEVLCKVPCHSICCLIHSIFELGIQPKFYDEADEAVEPEPIETLAVLEPVAIGADDDAGEAWAWV
jgi:hypothetical protein